MKNAALNNSPDMHTQFACQPQGICRHTFGRILAEARKVVAKTVIKGLALQIQGGVYIIAGCDDQIVRRGPGGVAGCVAGINNQAHPVGREYKMNRIAIASEGPGLDDLVDLRFGRATGFVIVDLC